MEGIPSSHNIILGTLMMGQLKWIIEKIKNFWEATHLMYKIREEKKRGT
jgi:hypothetical protein